MADPLDDPVARNRFMILNLVRLCGLIMVLAGLAVESGALDWPREVAFVLVIAGFVDFFLVPRLVARQWRSPPE